MPRRRCVGCGRIAPKRELIRVVAGREEGDGGKRAVLDPAARLPGRGAYLCRGRAVDEPSAPCLTRATRRNALARALSLPAPAAAGPLGVDPAEVQTKPIESVGQ